MLYFLYGTDLDKARDKASELVLNLQKKKPDAAVFKMNDESWSAARFDELIGGQGLFENRYIVLLSRVFENEEAKETVIEWLKEIAESGNIFIIREGKCDKATVEKIKKRAAKVQEFVNRNGDEPQNQPDFNAFSLTDAFGRRDRKNLWVLYQKALAASIAPEEIHGILFWQLKNMFLAKQCKTANEAELKPFVWSKASSFAKNYSLEELRKLSSVLVDSYHLSRLGGPELEIALEKIIFDL